MQLKEDIEKRFNQCMDTYLHSEMHANILALNRLVLQIFVMQLVRKLFISGLVIYF